MRPCLLCIVLLLASASIPALCGTDKAPLTQQHSLFDSSSDYATLEDVRLLANGLLQLGQSMRDFIHKTKRQINDIFQKLNVFDHSFSRMSVLASEIKEKEEELKEKTVVLQANNQEIKGLSEEMSTKMDGILKDKSQLQSKVEVLERRLSRLSAALVTKEWGAEINKLKEVVNNRDQSITELLNAVNDQSDQLNHQQKKIQTLEEKILKQQIPSDEKPV